MKNGWLAVFFQKVARRIVLCMPLFMRDGLWLLFDSNGNLEFCLRKLKEKGFAPDRIVDCGGYMGNWTRLAKKFFPAANVLIIEPQADKEPLLARVCADFPGSVNYVRCLLGPDDGREVTFYEMESGSSVLHEVTSAPRRAVTHRMRTLDSVLREKNFTGAAFLKLDVQGYELEALKGAGEAMRNAEVILLEVSLVPFNESAPIFHEVVAFMKDRGFLIYDVCPLHRWDDNTLFQADVFFVKDGSSLRKINFRRQ